MAKDAATEGTTIELILPTELFARLERIAEASGLPDVTEAAMVGLAEWAAGRQTELDNRDPAQRYFINEALDELLNRSK